MARLMVRLDSWIVDVHLYVRLMVMLCSRLSLTLGQGRIIARLGSRSGQANGYASIMSSLDSWFV